VRTRVGGGVLDIATDVLIFLLAGAAAGGFVSGLAGYGTALFALGFWLTVMPPIQAVAIGAGVGLLTGVQSYWVVRREIVWSRAALLLVPALIGLPLGQIALTYADPTILRLLIASLLMMNGVFFLFRSSLPKLQRSTPRADMSVGFIGGIIGGFAGIAGALPSMWVALKACPKLEHRALMQPFVIAILLLTITLMTLRGAYTPETLNMLMVAVPVTIISGQLGLFVFKRLADPQFHTLVLLLLFFSGSAIMVKELL